MNYRQADLNLLMIFEALMTERHVSRAATRAGLSQPAMSHALRRLRLMLNDPVLVSVGRSMQPTPTALRLAPVVRDIITKASSLTSDVAFEPARCDRRFVLGMSDYAALRILPDLNIALRHAAPGVRLVVRHVGRGDGPLVVDSGEVDLAIGTFLNMQGLRTEFVLEEPYLCAVWRGNKQVKGPLTLEQYLKLSHVLVESRGDSGGVVDFELNRRNLRRHISCIVPHFLVAPAVVRGTDLILTLAEGALRDQAKALELKLLPPPLELPSSRLEMLWHARNEDDPSMRWLRGLISDINLARSK
jgi:DNA-binding transcriptional LysR family regulator